MATKKEIAACSVQLVYDKGAVSVSVTPQAVVLKRGRPEPERRVYVDLYDGGRRVDYQTEGFVCSTLNESPNTEVAPGVTWGFGVDNGRFYYRLRYLGATDVKAEIPFTVSYGEDKYPYTLQLLSVADGEGAGTPGKDGLDGIDGQDAPWTPPPMLWDDYPEGYAFEAGDPTHDERRLDVVGILDSNNEMWLYRCLRGHVKNARYKPGTNAAYWEEAEASRYRIVATQLMMANNARIDFLSGQAIKVGTKAGGACGYFGAPTGEKNTILFSGAERAEDATFAVDADGTVRGSKMEVEGKVRASLMELKTASHDTSASDGALCLDEDHISLPELEPGIVRMIKVLNPMLTRTSPTDLYLERGSANVRISTDLRVIETGKNLTLPGMGLNGGAYLEIVGYHSPYSSVTEWRAIAIKTTE
ncbi:MAG: hypothetical protein HDQ88_02275 [Clostridia bacterium]|nr:hypothetical protein [Clostridia bacterium]